MNTTALPASLTLRDAPAALESLRSALLAAGGTAAWRVDAAPLRQLDTSAIAVLLELQRLAAEARRSLELVDPPQRLLDLAKLYGVDGLIGAGPAAGPTAG